MFNLLVNLMKLYLICFFFFLTRTKSPDRGGYSDWCSFSVCRVSDEGRLSAVAGFSLSAFFFLSILICF